MEAIVLLIAVMLISLGGTARREKLSPNLEKTIAHCRNAPERGRKIQCWVDLLDEVIKAKGVGTAFDTLTALYTGEPGFAEACHDITHRIGETAYGKFARHEDFAVPPQVAFCNYGFYHGFMEALASAGGSAAEARSFCASIEATLGAETPDAAPQCFHGIGHGMVNGHEPALWGNAEAMADRALGLCEAVADTADRRYRCAAGVFNGLAIFYARGEYGLGMSNIDPRDPLRICREQPIVYRKPCYGNMKLVLDKITDRDFTKIAAIIERIPDDEDAASTIWYLAGYHMKQALSRPDHADEIRVCRSLRAPLRLPCIQGLATGFLWNGFPGREYEGAIHFCGAERLSHDERQACFDKISSLLPIFYPMPRVMDICRMVPAPYRAQCGGRK